MDLPQPVQHYVNLAILLILSSLVNSYLLRFYRKGAGSGTSSSLWRWLDRWTFSPEKLGGFSYRQLVFVSMAALFLELLMIRWISSEIRIFAYFKNFVLIACFLGLGLGASLCRRKLNLLGLLAPLTVLVALINLSGSGMRSLIQTLPVYLGSASEVQIWGVPTLPWNWTSLLNLSIAVAAIVPLFTFISLAFVPLGQLIGWYLETAPEGVLGYTVNVLGSLMGIILYTLLCFLSQPPSVWFLAAGLMLFALFWRFPLLKWSAAAFFAFYAISADVTSTAGSAVYWSPYQKLSVSAAKTDGELTSYVLRTNGSWYQQIIDLSPRFVAAHPKLFTPPAEAAEWNAYNLPYHFYQRPSSVLILGAGMGNDVAAAVRNDAERVVAVEIDPLILKLGRRLHFERPYDSARVHVVVDDARSYLQRSTDHFDLIVFSLLDSHTTSSYFSNIRIDNYVYTVEALRAAKQRLQPDGIFIVKFAVMTPWIAGRLQNLIEAAFGQKPVEINADNAQSGGHFFVAGSSSGITRALAEPGLAKFVAAHSSFEIEPASLTTDNWPYFYQHEPGLPASVIVIALALVALCWSFLRQTGLRQMGAADNSTRWVFFFLGAGFMLLEAQIVSKVALLFGTTWVVNSIVVSGLLILIVAANTVSELWRGIPLWLGYLGLFSSLLLDYLIPIERYFFASLVLKILVVTAVLCLPVFFAGIVFIRVFAAERFSGEALGSNLLGALIGGMLESLSLWTGIRSLLIVAGILYLLSWMVLRGKVWVPRLAPQAMRMPDAS